MRYNMNMVNKIDKLKNELQDKVRGDLELIATLEDISEFLDSKEEETRTISEKKEDLLYEVGVALFKLEGAGMDCPLRELREKIEKVTKLDFNKHVLKIS